MSLEELRKVAEVIVAKAAKFMANQDIDTPKGKPKKNRMSTQNQFSADGPALFMGRGKRVSVTLQGHTTKMRIWDQPVEVHDRLSRRDLRVRQGKVPRLTSTPTRSPK